MKCGREWRCTRCNKLLGLHDGVRLHIRFARSHEYFVGLPVTATCRGCGALNEYPPGIPEKDRRTAVQQ